MFIYLYYKNDKFGSAFVGFNPVQTIFYQFLIRTFKKKCNENVERYMLELRCSALTYWLKSKIDTYVTGIIILL